MVGASRALLCRCAPDAPIGTPTMHSPETEPLVDLDNGQSQPLFDNLIPNYSHKRNALGVGPDA